MISSQHINRVTLKREGVESFNRHLMTRDFLANPQRMLKELFGAD